MSLPNNDWIWKEVVSYVAERPKTTDAICVIGASGIGKTHRIKGLVEELGWDAYWIHSANCQSAKEFRDMLVKGLKTNLLSNLAQVTAQKVVIIDEVEVLLQLDRTMSTALSDAIYEHRNSKGRIVLIGNSVIEKKMNSMRGTVRMLQCCTPSDADMFLWCKDHAPKGMKKTMIMDIAEASQGNPGNALSMMKTKSQPIFDTFKAVQVTERDLLRLKLLDDPWLYPLRFHENLVKEVAKKKGTKVEKQKLYSSVLKMLCDWDLWMCAGCDPNIAVEHVLNAMTTVLQTLDNKKGCEKDVVYEDFTKVFSNLSLQKKQERTLYARTTDFPWMHAQIFCDYKHYK